MGKFQPLNVKRSGIEPLLLTASHLPSHPEGVTGDERRQDKFLNRLQLRLSPRKEYYFLLLQETS
jgi:hypothetical protein